MAFYNNVIAGAAGSGGAAAEFKIERSLRITKGDQAHLNRTPSSAGNRKTFTFSFWIKRTIPVANFSPTTASVFGASGGSSWFDIGFYTSDELQVITNAGVGDTGVRTQAVFRDFSSWYHFVVAVDTTNSTAADRIIIYVNGVRQAVNTPSGMPSQNSDTFVNSTNAHYFGRDARTSSVRYGDNYFAEINFVDGQALAATDFGEFDATTGAWNPIKFAGSHGTNGFHLDFKNNSSSAALGYDAAGSNNWTVNNIIADPGLATAKQGMDVLTYTGNGSARSISGLEFQPDFVWIKSRNASHNHMLFDVVRGAGVDLMSNATSNENSGGANDLTQFNSDGFNLSTNNAVNQSSVTFAAWCWKAGGTATTNTTGTRQSSVSANNTYGFSITTWTGDGGSSTTVGHGLNSAPDWVIIKNRDGASSWHVYARAVDSTGRYGLYLNGDNSKVDFTNPFFDADDNTINLYSASVGINATSTDYVAYSWTEIPGFSKFGTYAGTGSAHTVNLGFRPRYLIYKSATASSTNWHVFDTARNNGGTRMLPNLTAGDSGPSADAYAPTFTDTGFTVAAVSDTHTNASGHTYFYAAFADKPDQSIIDSLIDTPTNADADSGNNGGNYATFNPLYKLSEVQIANGNLDLTWSGGSGHAAYSTIAMYSGKYYFEITSGANTSIGIRRTNETAGNWPGTDGAGYGYAPDGRKVNSASYSSFGTAHSNGDIIGVAFDADSGKLWFSHNGTWQASGDPAAGNNPAYTVSVNSAEYGWYATVGYWTSPGTNVNSANFGQRAFAYTPPTGYKSLCTQNLPDPLIANPSTEMDVRSGLNAQFTINDLGFEPGLVVAKSTSHSEYWIVADKLRNFIGGLRWNDTNAEGSGDAISSVGATGYQSNYNWFNTGRTYATFNWDAGSSNTSISTGSLNSSAYDQRTTWTNGLTADDRSFNSSYPATQFFDGNKTTFASTGGSGGGNSSGTVDLGNYFPSSNGPYRVEVGCTSANATVTIGGVQHDTADPSNNAIRIWTSVASVPSIVMDDQGAFGGSHIIINGKLLVDSGVSVANVPSIASTVRANPSAGFSIVRWTGSGSGSTTVGHGLNAAPHMFLVKDRGNARNWLVYHTGMGATKGMQLNLTTHQSGADAGYWNNTAPTSTTISLGTYANESANYIAYCFAPVAGYSAFGKYTGNASADGPFVYTGFRPALTIIKCFSTSNSYTNWDINDSSRDPSNVADATLAANQPDQENSGNIGTQHIDFLSNGFKIRQATSSSKNLSGQTYLYAAFAENPFKTARAR